MLVSRCPRPALLLFGGLSVGRPQEGATRSHASLKWGLEGTSGFTSGFTLPLPPTVRCLPRCAFPRTRQSCIKTATSGALTAMRLLERIIALPDSSEKDKESERLQQN